MVVKAGQTDAIINFKGGSIVDFARKPASYSTSDPLYQAIIENSIQFQRGEIKLMGAIEVPDDAATIARKAASQASAGDVVSAQPKTANSIESESEKEKVSHEDDVANGPTEDGAAGESEETSHEDEDQSEAAGSIQTVEVVDKRDAIDWLKEHYPEAGYNGNNLRSAENFKAACDSHGVVFKFTANE